LRFEPQKIFTIPLKFSFKATVVILKNVITVKVVVKTEVQSAFFAEREFTCWRDREYNDLYPCEVSGQGKDRVGLNLDIVSFSFASAVAEEIARSLYDAVLIIVGNIAGFVPTPAARESVFNIKYRKSRSGEWSYIADGRFNCQGSENEVYFVDLYTGSDEKTNKVSVYTVEEGGVELVFNFMGYSFSMLDAVWLCNALMEAIGEEPLDLLETTTM
jgi:hypothetical protein